MSELRYRKDVYPSGPNPVRPGPGECGIWRPLGDTGPWRASPGSDLKTRVIHTWWMGLLLAVVLTLACPDRVYAIESRLAHEQHERARLEVQLVLDRSFRGIW